VVKNFLDDLGSAKSHLMTLYNIYSSDVPPGPGDQKFQSIELAVLLKIRRKLR
jgi:BCL2-associated athanogene 2